jgi:K+-sensing histidine kinase KdpD
VPDQIVDQAEVEVIDLTPDDLIQRLREGKVYIPEQAERALKHYFSPGNLTALRELALRRAAERVDEQMVSYARACHRRTLAVRTAGIIDESPCMRLCGRKRMAERCRGS